MAQAACCAAGAMDRSAAASPSPRADGGSRWRSRVVIAAIVIASALMMDIQPVLAGIGYVVSAIIGLYLVISTLMHDRRDQEKAKMKGR